MRILAVDPGSKRIGLAISDPTATIASPLPGLVHISKEVDAALIRDVARHYDVNLIVIGQSFNTEGELSFEGRHAFQLAEAIKPEYDKAIVFWDEAFTTQDARKSRIQMNVKRKNRSGHLFNSLAAAILLQSYLDQIFNHH